MATTRGKALQGNIQIPVNYILDLAHDRKKTEQGTLTYTNMPCLSPELAGYSFVENQYNRRSKYCGYHFQFSLPEGEGSPEECLEMAKEWIEAISDQKANYVIAVHTNTPNIHAHIISGYYLQDGKGWDIRWFKDSKTFRYIADRICKEHGLSVLEKTSYEKSQAYYEWMKNQRDSQRKKLVRILDTVISQVSSKEDFVSYLETLGFEVRTPKEKKDFTFTANYSLVKKINDNSYSIRIPKSLYRIQVKKENLRWVSQNQTAMITVLNEENIPLLNKENKQIGIKVGSDLKNYFQEKRTGYQSLAIKMSSGDRFIRTKYLSKEKDYSWEGVQEQINQNGLTQSSPNVLRTIQYPDQTELVNQERRNLFSLSNVQMTTKDSGVYVSVAQRRYYERMNRNLQAKIHRMIYEEYMENESLKLPELNQKSLDLKQERQNCYAILHQLEDEKKEWEKDQLECSTDLHFSLDQEPDAKQLNNQIQETRTQFLDQIEMINKEIQSTEKRIKEIRKFKERNEPER